MSLWSWLWVTAPPVIFILAAVAIYMAGRKRSARDE